AGAAVGVPLLSGAVSMEGVGTAAVIAGSATVGSALSKINVPVGSLQYSFAKSYEDYSKSVKRMGPRKGKTPGNNQSQNKQFNDIIKKYKLNKAQQRTLHEEITGQGMGYHEIEEIARDIVNGK
ncbi:hypothetical protein, partial [Lactovum odontotermitis]